MKSKKKTNTRSLQVETLESREMLSVHPLGIDQPDYQFVQVAPPQIQAAEGQLDKPANLAAAQTAGTVKLTWGPVEGAAAYKIYRSADSGATYELVSTRLVKNLPDPAKPYFNDAAEDGDYIYAVRAYDSALAKETRSDAAELNITAKTLNAPKLIDAVQSGAGAVKLAWSAVEGADVYKVYRSADGGATYELVSNRLVSNLPDASKPYFNDKELADGTYTYAVRAYKGISRSDAVTAKPIAIVAAVAAPVVAISQPAEKDVQLDWAAVTGATSYKVYRSDNGGTNYALVATTDKVTYTEENLEDGTYTYSVRALNAAGIKSDASAEVSATVPKATVAPAAPASVTATSTAPNTVALTWTAVEGADSYNIYTKSGEGEAAEYALVEDAVITGTTAALTGVTAGSYVYAVSAVNAAGESDKTAAASVDVADAVDTPDAPADLTGSQVAGNIVLNWADDAKASFYSVQRRLDGDTEWTLLSGNVTTSAYTDSALSADGKYEYSVRGWANADVSGDSSTVAVDYSASTPAVPVITAGEQISYTPADKGSVKLTFAAVTGAATYTVKVGTATVAAANVGEYADGGIIVKGIDAVKNGSFTIAAVNSAGASNFSTSVAVRVDSLAPDAALTISTVSQVGPGTAKIAFSEAADAEVNVAGKAVSYNIFGSKDGAAYTQLASGVKYTDSGLTVDGLSKGAWKLQIQAVNVIGPGPKSNEANVTIGDAPAAPATPSAAQQNNDGFGKSVVLLTVKTTEASPGANRDFTVYTSKDSGDYVKLVSGVTNGAFSWVGGVTTDTVTVTGLEAGALYSFKVTVSDEGIESAQSNSSSVINLVDVPKAGTNGTTFPEVTPVQTAAKTVQLRFNAVGNAAYYTVAINGNVLKVGAAGENANYASLNAAQFVYNTTLGGIIVDWSATRLITGNTSPDDQNTGPDTSSDPAYGKWIVTAVNAAGTLVAPDLAGDNVPSLVTTKPTDKPTNVAAAQTKAGTVKITADPGDGQTQQYKVFKSTDGGLTQTEVAASDLSDNTKTGVTVNNLALGAHTFFLLPTNFVDDGENTTKSAASNVVTVVPVAAAPTNVTAKQVGETIRLTFAQVGTIANYNVYASANSADYGEAITAAYVPGTSEVPGHIVVSSGLTRGVNYRFKVAAVDSNIEGTQSAATAAVTLVNVLAPPAKVEGAQTGAGQVKLTFENVSGADSYKVYVNNTAVVAANVGSYANGGIIVSGVDAGDNKSFTLAAVNVAGEGAKSGAAVVTVVNAVAISSVTGKQVGGGKVELTLVGVGGGTATSYIVRYSTDNTNYTTVAAANTTVEDGKVYVTGLAVNTTGYSFAVTGVNAAGNGNESAGSPKVPVVTAPVAVATPVATSDTENSAKLTFTQIQGVGNYIVYSSIDNFAAGTQYTYASGGVAVTNHPAGNYTFKVSYKSGTPELESTYSAESNSVAIKGTPDVPKDVKAANTAAGTVKLTFAAVPSVTGYKVYKDSDDVNALTTASPYANGGITVTGLSAGPHTFKVVAVNADAVGAKESALSAETQSVAVLVAPTVASLTAAQTADRTVTLSIEGATGYDAANGNVTYTVYYSTDDTSYSTVPAAQVASNPGGASDGGTIVVNGLLEGQGYYFKVVASNTIADSQPSDATEKITIAGTLAKITPAPVATTAGADPGKVKVTFTSITSGTDTVTYQLYSSADNYAAALTDNYTSEAEITAPAGTGITFKVGYKVVHTSTGVGDLGWTKYGALSDASNALNFLPPAAPDAVTAAQVGTPAAAQGTVKLSFAEVSGATSYKVYKDDEEVVSATVPVADFDNGITITGLDTGSHTFRVSAVNAFGEGEKSAATTTPLAVVAKPDTPDGAKTGTQTPDTTTAGNVTVAFTSVASTYYKVYLSDDTSVVVQATDNTGVKVTGVAEGKSVVGVTKLSSQTNPVESEKATVTQSDAVVAAPTAVTNVAGAPTDETSSDNNDGKIAVTFDDIANAATGATSYAVSYKLSSANVWESTTLIASGSDIEDLAPGTYDVRVVATFANGEEVPGEATSILVNAGA
jgi:fibronectin type 3 domain-containing protein